MMTLEECFQKYKGLAVLVPNGGTGNNGQCVQWADTVLHEVYGLPYVYTPAAKDFWYNAAGLGLLQNFDLIATDRPIKKGDFIIYDPLSSGDPQGHIDVASQDGIVSDFYAYDSNWNARIYHDDNGYPTLHEVHHNDSFNSKVIGYLRPKGGSMNELISNDDQAAECYRSVLKREPSAQEIKDCYGQYWLNVIKSLRSSPEGEVLNAVVDQFPKLQAENAQLKKGTTKDAALDYVNKNLK